MIRKLWHVVIVLAVAASLSLVGVSSANADTYVVIASKSFKHIGPGTQYVNTSVRLWCLRSGHSVYAELKTTASHSSITMYLNAAHVRRDVPSGPDPVLARAPAKSQRGGTVSIRTSPIIQAYNIPIFAVGGYRFVWSTGQVFGPTSMGTNVVRC
jgi:hypothetical protein